MNPAMLRNLGHLSFFLGFASVIGAIVVWNANNGETAEATAQAERLGIFVGLWAPTFFALSNALRRLSLGPVAATTD